MTLKIGARDFGTDRFNKNEFNFFRVVTRYINSVEPIALLEPATITAVIFSPVAQADAPIQSAAYVQAEAQATADLANANKAALNAVIAQLQTQNDQLVAQNTILTNLLAAVGNTPV